MNYRFAIGKFLIFISLTFYNGGKGQEVPKGPIDFSKLELNTKELLGSRWTIEHPNKTIVYHKIQIVDMVKVDVNDMSIRVDFYVRQRWQASGLDFPEGLFKDDDKPDLFISAEENVLQSVWSPDSFIPNARDAKILSTTTIQSAVNIFKNKTILYKARMYAVLGCSFLFQWYPLDIQICDMAFQSYKYTKESVHYEWETESPVTALSGILLYQYDVVLPPRISNGTVVRWSGNYKYPYVKMTFKFERKLGNNVIQLFVPTILVVTLSFFSFWLGLDAVPGRISLLVTCILTLVTMHSGLRGVIPPVHYVKMSDIWMIGCMVFVFGAICEFIVVKYLKWRSQQMKDAKTEQENYLKQNGLLQNYSPSPPPRIPNERIKMAAPNVVYPSEYGQHRLPFSHNNPWNPMTNSAQKRQAWQNAQVAHSLGVIPGGDYSSLINMQGHLYNQRLLPPPPNSRPIWVQIDKVCRALFPLLFAIFNAVYWPILLEGSASQHKDV